MKRTIQFQALLVSAAILFTNIPVPVCGAETIVGNDTEEITRREETCRVSSLDGLVSALNGEEQTLIIQLDAVSENAYCFSENLDIPENKNVTIDLNGQSFTVSSSFIQSTEHPFTLAVPDTSTLTLKNTNEKKQADLSCKIVNDGKFFTERGSSLELGFWIENEYSNALDNRGEATLQDGDFENSTKNQSAIINSGNLELGSVNVWTTADHSYALYNTGMTVINGDLQDTNMNANGYHSVGIYNDGTGAEVTLHSGYQIEAYNEIAVVNVGGVVTREQIQEDETGLISGYIGVLTVSDGIYTQYGGETEAGFGVATTPLAAPYLNLLGNGKTVFYGGDWNYTDYAFAYAGENYPRLLDGMVQTSEGAVVQLLSSSADSVSVNADAMTSHYESYNQENLDSTYAVFDGFEAAEDANTYRLRTEIDLTENSAANDSASDSEVKRVGTYEELTAAMESDCRVMLIHNIALSGNLLIEKKLQLVSSNYCLVGDSADDQITVQEDADLEVSGAVRFMAALSGNHPAITNYGSISLSGGSILVKNSACNAAVAAIVYTEGHEPLLMNGILAGAKYTGDGIKDSYQSISEDDLIPGSAVALDNHGEYQTGSYKNSTAEGAPLINSLNAGLIRNGQIQTDCSIHAKEPYLLLEPGERISEAGIALFSKVFSGISANSLHEKLISSDTNVVSVSGMELSAEHVGTAFLTNVIETISENGQMRQIAVSDQIRIEVCADRAAIIGQNYQANILEDHVDVNGYYREKLELPVSWSLKECFTGGSQDVIEQTFCPDSVIITNQEFNEYFTYDSKLYYDNQKKEYKILYQLKDGNCYSKFLENKAEQLKNIQVTLCVTNKCTNTQERIDAGSFEIQSDNVKPSVVFMPRTVNTVYAGNLSGNQIDLDDKTYAQGFEITEIEVLTIPKGFEQNRYYGYYTYEGTPCKKKVAFTANVTLKDYYGTWQSDIPVTLVKHLPKVSLETRKFYITKNMDQGNDLYDSLTAKDDFSLRTVQSIELTGKNMSYQIVNQKKDGSFYLQPTTNEARRTTLTLRVTYRSLRMIRGKEYSTRLKVTISPVSKYSMKPVTKKVSLSAEDNQSVQYRFQAFPGNDSTGSFYVLNPNEDHVLVSSIYLVDQSKGIYGFDIASNDKTKELPSNQKKLSFEIYWYTDTRNEQQLCKPLKLNVRLVR